MAIAITRPQGKGDELTKLLSSQGIHWVKTPVLTLEMLPLEPAQLAPLMDADVVVFISQDAVKGLATHVKTLPETAEIFAVGEQTSRVVKSLFGRVANVPAQQDSEGLLALAQLQSPQGKQVMLVKGVGGRSLLANTFQQRQAILNQCNVYRRSPAQPNSDAWLDHWRNARIQGIVVTSNAAIDAIFNTDNQAHIKWLRQCHYYVISQRIADYIAAQYQLTSSNITIASGPSDRAIFDSIIPEQKQQGSPMSEQENQSVDTHAQPPQVIKQKVSKIGVLALFFALLGGGATAGLIIHGQQISDKTYQALAQLEQQNAQLSKALNVAQAQLTELAQRQPELNNQISARFKQQAQQFDTQLQAALSSAQQQVSGALRSEVLYLQRMAQFKASVERDFAGSVAVLQRLTDVLSQEPNTGPLITAIAADIALLRSQPEPQVEAFYIQLHGLLAQVEGLELQTVRLPEYSEQTVTTLTDDVNDWQSNLKQTWKNVVDDFIKVRHTEVAVIDPLLDLQEQQLLKAQLRSYLLQAQTALMDKQASIFFTALKEAEATLTTYFKKQTSGVSAMQEALIDLQQQPLAFDKAIRLNSGQVLSEWLQ